MAVGALRAFGAANVRVPDDIAVVGFDDIEMSEFLHPPLTTVHADAYRLGERAVERVMRLMNDPSASGKRHEILPTTLVVRESCGATRSSHDSRNSRRAEAHAPGRRTPSPTSEPRSPR